MLSESFSTYTLSTAQEPLSGGSGENGEIDGGREADGAEAALEGCAAEALADVPPVEVQAQHVPLPNSSSPKARG